MYSLTRAGLVVSFTCLGVACSHPHAMFPPQVEALPMPVTQQQATVEEADSSSVCRRIAAQWPHIVRQSEAMMRQRDKAAFEAELAEVRSWLKQCDVSHCPQWVDRMVMQQELVNEYEDMYDMHQRAAAGLDDLPPTFGGRSVASLRAEYVEMHAVACLHATEHIGASWAAWRRQGTQTPVALRQQRHLSNLETDETLVQRDGSVGQPIAANDFIALVHTPVVPELSTRLTSLQGQGPMVGDAAVAYVEAAMHYAQRHEVAAVTFVNVAGGQVPSFAQQVEQASALLHVPAQYVQYDGWRDGSLVTPAQAVQLAARIAAQMERTPGKTQLVVNCNAGLDRSGMINALVQLMRLAHHDQLAGCNTAQIVQRGFSAIPSIVRNIKAARPRGVSSEGRYMFIYKSYAAYAQSLEPAPN